MKLLSAALAFGAALAVSAPAIAQETSYVPTTVWEFSQIKVEPGQFQNYMDYLSGNYRKQMELGKQMGDVVSYHIFQVNNPRRDEPDLVLAVEFKDYTPVAEKLAIQRKLMAAMATDPHRAEAAAGERTKMRTEMGSVEMQELRFK
jgi:hypothetical protein